ncbi:AMP-binding protein [Kitasatospora sp. NPDC091257]|uniref:AMP-binding protein n=1 Tax=Kitasatospora sp. NPDC091257 TaxID=3364084 RepID=UPI003823AE1F
MVANCKEEVAMGDAEFVSGPALILRSLASDPDRRAVVTADGAGITAGALAAAAYRLSHELIARGAALGTTVTLLTGNTPEALVARYAAGLAGARVVNLYDGMSEPVLAEISASVDTTLLLVDAERYASAARLLPLLDGPTVLTLGPGPADRAPGALGEDVIAAAAHRPAEPPDVRIGPEDDLGIRHTGGTTGIPKGILSLHGPYRRVFDAPVGSDPVDGAPRLLAATPLAHLAGIMSDLTLQRGGTVVLQRSFDPGAVLAAVERERITDLWVLPALLHQLLDHPAIGRTDLSSLRQILYGGSAASPTRIREALKVFGPVLVGVYGMSEAQLISYLTPQEHVRIGPDSIQVPVGRPAPGVEVAIRSLDGTDLPTGEQGEVHLRSDGIMAGYWKRPDLTAAVLRDGWLNTGDVGYFDEDGYLYLSDRVKDLIIVVGGHVYPSEVEDLLLTHPTVARCAVFGVRDDQETEHVHVAVVPAPGQRPRLDELRAFVTERKGRIFAPEALHLVDEIPLTPVGKPDKKRLREAATA